MMVDLTSLKDEHLLARFGAGEVGALGVLAERHEGHLVGLATGLLDGRGDVAQDVVQGAWLRVIRYGKRFEGRSSFRTWMYRIVINGCRDGGEEWAKKEGRRLRSGPRLRGVVFGGGWVDARSDSVPEGAGIEAPLKRAGD